MAGQYTPEEYQDILDAYNKALISGMDQNSAAFKQLKENLDDAKLGIKNYTYTMKQASQQLGSSMLAAGKQISSGAQGAAVFNDALTSGANLASKALERFGPWGRALGLATKALGAYIGAVNKQSDALYKSYQEISRTGAIGAGGMTEVYQNLKQFGYGIDELGNMGALLADNGKNLALFSGSVSRGTGQIADLAQGVKDSDLRRQFMNLGLSVDAQNQMIAGYAVQQGRLGKSTDLTTKGMAAYVREQEILTRLTGQSAREMQDQFEAALQMDDFMAGIMDMPEEAQKQAKIVINQLNAIDPSGKMARGFAASVNGLGHTTEEGAQMFAASNGKSQEAAMALAKGTLSASEYLQQYGNAVSQNIPTMKGLSKVGANYMGNLATNVRLTQLSGKGFAKVFDETGRAVDNAAAGFDDSTNSASELRIAQMNSRDSMENMLQHGVKPVTMGMELLAKAIDKLLWFLPGSSSIANARKEQEQLEKQRAQLAKDVAERKKQLDDAEKKKAELEKAKQEGKPAEVIAAKEDELKKANTAINAAGGDLAQATAVLAGQQTEKIKQNEKNLEQIKKATEEAAKEAASQQRLARTAEEKARAQAEAAKVAQELLEKEKKAKAEIETAQAERKRLEEQEIRDARAAAQKKLEEKNQRATGKVSGLGKVAAQYESGGDFGKVSTGKGDHGGKSYGAFQLSSKTGDLDKFLEKSGYAEKFKGLSTGSTEFDEQWKSLAKSDKNFGRAQQEHAKQTHYDPQVAKLRKAGVDLSGKGSGVQEAIMSTGNQYGANTELIVKALKDRDVGKLTDKEIIDAIQDYKAANVKTNFKSSSEKVQKGVANRIEQERVALYRAGNEAAPVTVAANPSVNKPTIPEAANGNVLTGPASGYRAVLHRTEAVVPLPDGRTIPVTIAGLSEQNDRLAEVLSAIETRLGTDTSNNGGSLSDTLIKKLDDLIRVASDQLGVSGKILKAQA